MKELVEQIARGLVDYPDEVEVNEVKGSEATVLELRAHPEDLGKLIGREGRIVRAIRTLLGAAGMKMHRRFTLVIVEEPARKSLGEHSSHLSLETTRR